MLLHHLVKSLQLDVVLHLLLLKLLDQPLLPVEAVVKSSQVVFLPTELGTLFPLPFFEYLYTVI